MNCSGRGNDFSTVIVFAVRPIRPFYAPRSRLQRRSFPAGKSRERPAFLGDPVSGHDGQKLVAPNSNVKLGFSGHDVSGAELPPGTTARLTSTRADGSTVHQILANYQTCLGPPCTYSAQNSLVDGGNGFRRILRVSPLDDSISVETCSPFVDQVLTDPGNRFILEMN